jgi:hypothetical protein
MEYDMGYKKRNKWMRHGNLRKVRVHEEPITRVCVNTMPNCALTGMG